MTKHAEHFVVKIKGFLCYCASKQQQQVNLLHQPKHHSHFIKVVEKLMLYVQKCQKQL